MIQSLLDMFYNLFGTYEPIQSVVSGTVEGGDIVYEYSVNFGYIGNIVLVAITLYSLFRLIGMVLGGGK